MSICLNEFAKHIIPYHLITYISDSLYWIVSLWNGHDAKNGLPYYGWATIEGDEIVKLKKILIQWKELQHRN